jgi:LmbE family N-acetylglucosaminyl deacetylase
MNTTLLPAWTSALAVVAHPDDESFGLGAIIDTFVQAGTAVHVLCLTQGEASTLGVQAGVDLAAIRAEELREAGSRLGVASTSLTNWPDGGLAASPESAVIDDILSAITTHRPDGLLVFEPHGITGHPDHIAATARALTAAEHTDLPVLAWTLPATVADTIRAEHGVALHGDVAAAIDIDLPVARKSQRQAIAAHASQAGPGSILWRRLELLGDHETLRWLRRPAASPDPTL